MHNAYILEILRKSPDFAIFSHDVLEQLLDHCRLIQLEEEDFVWRKEDPAREVFVPTPGNLIRVGQHGPEGAYLNTGLVYQGNLIGEVELFGGIVKRHNDAETLSACDIVQISGPAFLQFVASAPHAKDYWLLMSNVRHSLAIRQLYALSRRSAKERLRRLIGILLDYMPIRQGEHFKLPVKQEILGRMVDLSRQTTNQLLREWEGSGLIEISHKEVIVHQTKYFLEQLR